MKATRSKTSPSSSLSLFEGYAYRVSLLSSFAFSFSFSLFSFSFSFSFSLFSFSFSFSLQIDSLHKLLLTGTPIMNNLMEMWALFDYTSSVCPSFFLSFLSFTSPSMALRIFDLFHDRHDLHTPQLPSALHLSITFQLTSSSCLHL